MQSGHTISLLLSLAYTADISHKCFFLLPGTDCLLNREWPPGTSGAFQRSAALIQWQEQPLSLCWVGLSCGPEIKDEFVHMLVLIRFSFESQEHNGAILFSISAALFFCRSPL